VRFYGRISYSFYLLHMLSVVPTMALSARWLEHLSPLAAALTLSALVTLATALPALAFYKLIEVPGVALGRRLAGAPALLSSRAPIAANHG
jgi:peptidoglycan/LPS O-acetylase OafA/YrhL